MGRRSHISSRPATTPWGGAPRWAPTDCFVPHEAGRRRKGARAGASSLCAPVAREGDGSAVSAAAQGAVAQDPRASRALPRDVDGHRQILHVGAVRLERAGSRAAVLACAPETIGQVECDSASRAAHPGPGQPDGRCTDPIPYLGHSADGQVDAGSRAPSAARTESQADRAAPGLVDGRVCAHGSCGLPGYAQDPAAVRRGAK